MRFDRAAIVVALVAVFCLSGCGISKNIVKKTVVIPVTVPVRVQPAVNSSVQERSFAGALVYLRSGNEQGARELLERVIEAPPVKGITDEAFFRLALLHLRDDGGKGTARAILLLERLAEEFPKSIWTKQAGPLADYLDGVKVLRDRQRELKTLRDLNLSLNRDNRDLRQTLERLKKLDIELEQKIKR